MTSTATLPLSARRRAHRPHRSAGPAAAPADLPRLLPTRGAVPVDLPTHLDRFGQPPYRGLARALITDVEAAGLTGRGGAAFPTHRKLAAVAANGPGAVVIGNGSEGEPASSKDTSLLWISPHLVLDGLQMAAEAVGTSAVGLYVRRSPRLRQRLAETIRQRALAGIDRAPVRLIDAPARFLAGEESALANVVAGGPALPQFRPPRVSERGVAGRPTLVQNVETLAHLALIARYGADWFRSVGADGEPGSMLATVRHPDSRVEVLEIPLGMPLADLLALDSTAAVLVGGYHGAWLSADQAARLSMSNAALRPQGGAVGAGVVAALPAGRCGLAETARIVRYLALESAGQCGPCFNGLPAMAAAFADLASPRPPARSRADLEHWAQLVERRGACNHPDGTVRLVRSALRVFATEIDAHAAGRCSGASDEPFFPLPDRAALDEADWR